MAKRPIFQVDDKLIVSEYSVKFEWFSGFSARQKQRSIQSLHRAAAEIYSIKFDQILEVSTKSDKQLGKKLSAFNLKLECNKPHYPERILLEAAFQASKVFKTDKKTKGPFPRLYHERSGREVKRYMKEFSKDQLKEFQFEGKIWDLRPKTAFYDWLYIRALQALPERDRRDLAKYQAFTDIEFNPEKSLNCQARSCALYVALINKGHPGKDLRDRDKFLEILKSYKYGTDSRDPVLLSFHP